MKGLSDVGVHSQEFRVISLFSGCDGLCLGLKLAVPEARVVCYVEQEIYACSILAARMEENTIPPAPVWSDVTTFDGKPWRGKVHCLAGGFPCTDISVAGKMEGIDGAASGLWKEFARIIGEVRPEFVYVENVSALLASGFGRVLGDLASLGYDAEWRVQSAASVGAPHERKRIFILAHRAEDVAHADSDALRKQPKRNQRKGGRERASFSRNTQLRESGEGSVVDSNGQGQLYGERPGHYDGRRLSDAGQEVDHADRGRPSQREGEGNEHQRRAGDASSPLEHAALQGLQDRGQGLSGERPDDPPLFPPGPGDTDFWRGIIRERPELAPAIKSEVRGMDHESAQGLDLDPSTRGHRLRALGNSVVPMAAAVAFRSLARRISL